jgi:hypothetical protein
MSRNTIKTACLASSVMYRYSAVSAAPGRWVGASGSSVRSQRSAGQRLRTRCARYAISSGVSSGCGARQVSLRGHRAAALRDFLRLAVVTGREAFPPLGPYLARRRFQPAR